jgi:hypothetical protein
MNEIDPTGPATPPELAPSMSEDDLAAVRELVLRAHPDIVPELLTGMTIADLTASIEPARAAYQRIAEQTMRPEPVIPPSVPAGGTQQIIDPDRLPTAEKLRRGLASRDRTR